MNVLLVSHGAALGGSPISLLNIAHHGKDPRIHYHFSFAVNGPIVARAKALTDSVHLIPHIRRFFGITIILRYLFLILFNKIDIVHLNTFTSYYKYPAIAAFLARRKVVWFVRENPEEKRCTKLRNYANILADKVVTVSYDTARHMDYIQNNILTTIHNGIDTQHFAPSAIIDQITETDSQYVLNISSFEPRKGVLELVRAFAESRTRDTFKLVLIGEDRSKKKSYINKLHETVRHLGLEDRVIFINPKQDVRPYIAQCTFFILVSYWEGLPRVLLEAAAMGKPILASRNGGNKEVVTNNINGILVDAGDISQITEGLNIMAEKSDLESMGRLSRNIATNKFSIECNINKLEELYYSL